MGSSRVGNTLSRLLYQRGLSGAQLAAMTGLSHPRINRIKNRRQRPTVRDALLIAKALGVPVATIFSVVPSRDAARPERDGAGNGARTRS